MDVVGLTWDRYVWPLATGGPISGTSAVDVLRGVSQGFGTALEDDGGGHRGARVSDVALRSRPPEEADRA
jgi:hypothetical protein